MPLPRASNNMRSVPIPIGEELYGCTRIEDGQHWITGVLVIDGTVWSVPAGLEWMKGKPLVNVAPLARQQGWTIWRSGPTEPRQLKPTEPDLSATTVRRSRRGGAVTSDG